jgi:cell division protein FtsB
MKAMLRGKFIPLSTFIKKLEISFLQLNKTPKSSRTKRGKHTQKEIVKLRAEINQLERNRTIKESSKSGAGF